MAKVPTAVDGVDNDLQSVFNKAVDTFGPGAVKAAYTNSLIHYVSKEDPDLVAARADLAKLTRKPGGGRPKASTIEPA